MLCAPPKFFISTFFVVTCHVWSFSTGHSYRKHVNMQEKLALAASVGHAPAIMSWHINSAAIRLIHSVGSVAVTDHYIYHQSTVNVE